MPNHLTDNTKDGPSEAEFQAIFTQLYSKHAAGVLRVLISGGLQSGDAEDVLHSSFLTLWEMRARLEDPANSAPLWYTIARHHMLDFIRRRRRMVDLPDDLQEQHATVDPEINGLDRDYLRKRITQALAELPSDMAEAYRLTKIAGLSVRDAATTLGLSESDIKSKVFRARKRLMEALADLGNFWEK